MIAKIKSTFAYMISLAFLVLGALFFAQKRKTESVESELASEKAQGAINDNEQDRQAARDTANDLVDAYERSKRGDS